MDYYNIEVPNYILWDISESSICNSYKICLPHVKIVNQYNKIMIDMMINNSLIDDDSWNQLEYIMNSDCYTSISNKFNNLDNNLQVRGKSFN